MFALITPHDKSGRSTVSLNIALFGEIRVLEADPMEELMSNNTWQIRAGIEPQPSENT